MSDYLILKLYRINKASSSFPSLHCDDDDECEFQKWMRMKGIRSAISSRSGCEYVQEWMRTISVFTKDDANGFGEHSWCCWRWNVENELPAIKILLDKW